MAQISEFVTKAWQSDAIVFLIDANDIGMTMKKLLEKHSVKCLSYIDFHGQTSYYSGRPYDLAIDGQLIWSPACGPAPYNVAFQARGKKIKLMGTSFKDWISLEKPQYSEIFGPGNDGIAFSSLALLWPEIVNLDRPNAFAVMEAELRRANAAISAFGFSIPISIMLFAGPSASVAILLYLLAHVRQIRSKQFDASTEFLWIALSGDIYSRALTIASFLLLPATSFTILLIAFFNVHLSWWSGVALSLIALSLGTIIIKELKVVRRNLAFSVAAGQASQIR